MRESCARHPLSVRAADARGEEGFAAAHEDQAVAQLQLPIQNRRRRLAAPLLFAQAASPQHTGTVVEQSAEAAADPWKACGYLRRSERTSSSGGIAGMPTDPSPRPISDFDRRVLVAMEMRAAKEFEAGSAGHRVEWQPDGDDVLAFHMPVRNVLTQTQRESQSDRWAIANHRPGRAGGVGLPGARGSALRRRAP